VQHELALFGTTMYTPDDYRQMIQLMAERKVTTEGMLTHTFTMDQIPEVFRFIDERREPFFKIMLRMDE
jgi:threonine dehydrogenase-like Zn-dependent dehydrogenase